MLTFSWDRCIAKHYNQFLKEGVVIKPIIDVVLERIRELVHELRPRSDLI